MIMTLAQIYLDRMEDEKVESFATKWNLSKHEAIKKMVRDFKEEIIQKSERRKK